MNEGLATLIGESSALLYLAPLTLVFALVVGALAANRASPEFLARVGGSKGRLTRAWAAIAFVVILPWLTYGGVLPGVVASWMGVKDPFDTMFILPLMFAFLITMQAIACLLPIVGRDVRVIFWSYVPLGMARPFGKLRPK